MQKLILVLSVVIFSQVTFAKKAKKKMIDIPPAAGSSAENPTISAKKKTAEPIIAEPDDQDLVKANKLQKRTQYLEAKNLRVVKVLPVDTQGLPHQKFVVQLSDERLVTVVSNLKLCEKIPLEINDIVSLGGEYIPTGKFSGIMHWTHFDPEKKRKNGYIAMEDKVFCSPNQ